MMQIHYFECFCYFNIEWSLLDEHVSLGELDFVHIQIHLANFTESKLCRLEVTLLYYSLRRMDYDRRHKHWRDEARGRSSA